MFKAENAYEFWSYAETFHISDVKNLPAMWEIWVQYLGQEDALKEGMATPSSILA